MNNTWKKSKRSDKAIWRPPIVRQAHRRQCSETNHAKRAEDLHDGRQQQTTAWPPGYEPRGEHMLVRLPRVPRSSSSVPWLTSLHATDGRGDYGSAAYRGNCSGLLIRDLVTYFAPKLVLDPMSGSGTCRDVCHELEIPCVSFDLAQGLDACDEANYKQLAGYDFVWLHPPYWKLIEYGDDPRCFSQAATLENFIERMRQLFRLCKSVLSRTGKIAVLIGDGRERGEYWGLPYRTLQAAESEGLWLAAPEIIRFGHGSTSSWKEYTTSFIPLLHDVCWVLKPVEKEDEKS